MEIQYNRIAVKIGSNVLTRADGTLNVTRMSSLVDQMVRLHNMGVQVILISSGAVASGRSIVHTDRKLDSVDQRQLFSAVGQVKLINRYYELFREQGITVGQVLTMKENFATRRLYLNQRNCMTVMLENNVIPIVNENDTVSVTELMFTDNDELSGLIASMMDVQALVILSNIDGIYDGAPDDKDSCVIDEVNVGDSVEQYIRAGKSSFGRGGMLTKTNIARKVAEEGIEVIIANGNRDNILLNLIRGDDGCVCTRFVPAKVQVSSVKKWIAHSEGFAKGELHLDGEVSQRLAKGESVSLLPIGITAVKGNFEKDDIVRVFNNDGVVIGVGKAACTSDEARAAVGRRRGKPVVHCDYLYVE